MVRYICILKNCFIISCYYLTNIIVYNLKNLLHNSKDNLYLIFNFFFICTIETFSAALHKIDIDRRLGIALNTINKVDSSRLRRSSCRHPPHLIWRHICMIMSSVPASMESGFAFDATIPWFPSAKSIFNYCGLAIKIVCIFVPLFI